MKVTLGILVCIIFWSCGPKELLFIEYKPGERHYSKVFFIRNFVHIETNEIAIDSFVCSRRDEDRVGTFNKFSYDFYKESSRTNLEYLEEYPRYFTELYTFSFYKGSFIEDYLFTYNIRLGNIVDKMKFKDGGYPFYSRTDTCR